jgi:hypothetical protein
MFRKELDRMDQEKEEAARMFRWENVRINSLVFRDRPSKSFENIVKRL